MKKFIRSIFKSKTVFFGFLITVLGAVQAYLPDLLNYIPEVWRGAVTAGVGITIILLRYATSKSLAEK